MTDRLHRGVAFFARPLSLAITMSLATAGSGWSVQSQAGTFDCGSDIVPIVHVESVGPVRFENDSPSDVGDHYASLNQHDDSALGGIRPVESENECGWFDDEAPKAKQQVNRGESPEAQQIADSTRNGAEQEPLAEMSVEASDQRQLNAAMLAGLAAGGRWMHFADPLQRLTPSMEPMRFDGLWDFACETMRHLSDNHLAAIQATAQEISEAELAESEAVPSSAGESVSVAKARYENIAPEVLVGGSVFVATIAEEYKPYDLAASDLPVWSSLAVQYRPFCIHADEAPVQSIDRSIASASTSRAAFGSSSVCPEPVADPVPNGDHLRPIAQSSGFIGEVIDDVELELALVLDEASRQMVAQRRADEAFAAVVDWIQQRVGSIQSDAPESVASRILRSVRLR